ncbi:MAG: hypothetical protein LBO66_07690 [Deltaproteobacteria bacterium]|jgi:hypothetical protein|nr:hypothetical protein [Deltaproteobacteria bacterium]
MAEFYETDFANILADGPFSRDIVYDPDGASVSFRAVVNEPERDSGFAYGGGAAQSQIIALDLSFICDERVLGVRLKKDDVFEVAGRLHRAYKIYRDGAGMSTVFLHKAMSE